MQPMPEHLQRLPIKLKGDAKDDTAEVNKQNLFRLRTDNASRGVHAHEIRWQHV